MSCTCLLSCSSSQNTKCMFAQVLTRCCAYAVLPEAQIPLVAAVGAALCTCLQDRRNTGSSKQQASNW
jgi:hypothetical protein